MARPEKVAKVEEVSTEFTGAAATLLTHYRGLSVTEISELRSKLRDAGAEMKVVKNTLTRRAAAKAGIEGLDELLVGPTGLIFCSEDPVGPAKVLRDFAKDHPDLIVRGGYLDGEVLDEVAAIKLADLASRDELLEKLAGLMYGALANTARLLNALPEKQARLMQALLEAGGAPGAPEAAAEEPAVDAAAEEPAVDAAAEEPAAEAAAEEPEAAPEADAEESAAEAAEDEPTAKSDDSA
jgi:large subunit ribosomal protein L10